jgi:chromosome segregation ATPase
MDYQEQLEQIQSEIETKKNDKIRLEEKKKQLEEQKSDIIEELASEDLTPDKLQNEINNLTKEIEEGIENCNSILENENEN